MELCQILNDQAKILPALELKKFDYDSLDSEIRTIVEQHTIEIKGLIRRTAQDNIDIGKKLSEVKQHLGHGKFALWLKAEFEWNEWTARKFIKVAQKFKSVNFTDLSIATSALYLLASSSTPDYACSEILALAAQGEVISYTKAKTIVSYHQKVAKSSIPESTELISVEGQITDSSKYSTVPHIALDRVEFQKVTERCRDKLPEEQEGLTCVQVSNLPYEMDYDTEESDNFLDCQTKTDIDTPFKVGDIMYLNDAEGQVIKLVGHVIEVQGLTKNEVVVKVLLQ
jgi:Protein of unknown function (DUF3102)